MAVPQIAGKGASMAATDFVTVFSPLAAFDAVDQRNTAWKSADTKGNGKLSLTECERWIHLKLTNELEKNKGTDVYKHCFPAYMRAFKAAARSGPDIDRNAFRLFAAHLCVYALAVDAFFVIDDTDTKRVSDQRDMRVSRDEWTAGVTKTWNHGFLALTSAVGSTVSTEALGGMFDQMDQNKNGSISLTEWCEYLSRMEQAAGTVMGGLLRVDAGDFNANSNTKSAQKARAAILLAEEAKKAKEQAEEAVKAAEEEAKQAADEAKARAKAAAEANAKKVAAEAEAQQKAEQEEKARKESEVAAAKKAAEEVEAKQKAEEEEKAKKAAEAAEAKKAAAEEEVKRKVKEEEKARKVAEAEAVKNAAEEAVVKLKAEEEEKVKGVSLEAKKGAKEAAEKRNVTEEEKIRKTPDTVTAKKLAEVSDARRRAEEYTAKKAAEGVEVKTKAADDLKAKKTAEDTGSRKKAAEDTYSKIAAAEDLAKNAASTKNLGAAVDATKKAAAAKFKDQSASARVKDKKADEAMAKQNSKSGFFRRAKKAGTNDVKSSPSDQTGPNRAIDALPGPLAKKAPPSSQPKQVKPKSSPAGRKPVFKDAPKPQESADSIESLKHTDADPAFSFVLFSEEAPSNPATQVLTAGALDRIAHHKYVSGTYTWLDNLCNPMWNILTEFLPMNMAPNLVTLVGAMHCLASYIWTWQAQPTAIEAVPAAMLVANAYCLFVAYTLDCMDGKQARRTQSSSPLGQLLDHGLDCLCLLAHVAAVQAWLRAGDTLQLQMVLQLAFYIAQWEEFYTGILPHATGPIGVTEVNYALALASLVHGLTGACADPNQGLYDGLVLDDIKGLLNNGWLSWRLVDVVLGWFIPEKQTSLTKLSDLFDGVARKDVVLFVWCGTMSFFCVLSLVRVMVYLKSTRGRLTALLQLATPVSLLCLALVDEFSDDYDGDANSIRTTIRWKSLAVGLLFCHITIKVIVFSMARQAVSVVQWDAAPLVAAIALTVYDPRLHFEGHVLVWQLLATFWGWRLWSWSSIAVNQICQRLNIQVWTIPDRAAI